MCENPLGRPGEVLAITPFIIPVLMGTSLIKLNEIRMFLVNHSLAKQQQVVLDIFR